MDLERVLADTPIKLAYFNHLAASIPPLPVVEEVNRYFDSVLAEGSASPFTEPECYRRREEARTLLARLVGAADPSEIAFTSCGSDALALVAGGLDWRPGDAIVTSELEFVSSYANWWWAARRFNLGLRLARGRPPGAVDLDHLASLLTTRTRLVALSLLPNSLGTLQPVADAARLAHSAGALFLLNACPGVGMVPLDVRLLGCDFLAGTGRKYLRGPTGTGFLYARRELMERLSPPGVGWNSGEWDYGTGEFRLARGGERFSTGEPAFPNLLGLGRALSYLEGLGGPEATWRRVRGLTARLLQGLRGIGGVTVYGPQGMEGRGAVVAFNVEGMQPAQVADALRREGTLIEAGDFLCPGPLRLFGVASVARFCLHYFNTEAQVDRALEQVASLASASGRPRG
ncbi:MAG: aminotransferase class V-fold PLP-dependent enzyme [Acetobacteraceae bacterium]|nr:aminotransferase class V-fold PLP-dependent enzyme [Acetobacteraceae bacterium]